MSSIASAFVSGFGAVPVISGAAAAGGLVVAQSAAAAEWLPAGTNSEQMLGMTAGLPAWQTALVLQSSTAAAGFALQNATPAILPSWTAPADGAQHRIILISFIHVTVNQTGGAVTLSTTIPDGTAASPVIFNGGIAAGIQSQFALRIVQSGSTVTFAQSSAQTAGAALVWAELWAS